MSSTQDLIEDIRSELEQVAAHILAYEKDFYDSMVWCQRPKAILTACTTSAGPGVTSTVTTSTGSSDVRNWLSSRSDFIKRSRLSARMF